MDDLAQFEEAVRCQVGSVRAELRRWRAEQHEHCEHVKNGRAPSLTDASFFPAQRDSQNDSPLQHNFQNEATTMAMESLSTLTCNTYRQERDLAGQEASDVGRLRKVCDLAKQEAAEVFRLRELYHTAEEDAEIAQLRMLQQSEEEMFAVMGMLQQSDEEMDIMRKKMLDVHSTEALIHDELWVAKFDVSELREVEEQQHSSNQRENAEIELLKSEVFFLDEALEQQRSSNRQENAEMKSLKSEFNVNHEFSELQEDAMICTETLSKAQIKSLDKEVETMSELLEDRCVELSDCARAARAMQEEVMELQQNLKFQETARAEDHTLAEQQECRICELRSLVEKQQELMNIASEQIAKQQRHECQDEVRVLEELLDAGSEQIVEQHQQNECQDVNQRDELRATTEQITEQHQQNKRQARQFLPPRKTRADSPQHEQNKRQARQLSPNQKIRKMAAEQQQKTAAQAAELSKLRSCSNPEKGQDFVFFKEIAALKTKLELLQCKYDGGCSSQASSSPSAPRARMSSPNAGQEASGANWTTTSQTTQLRHHSPKRPPVATTPKFELGSESSDVKLQTITQCFDDLHAILDGLDAKITAAIQDKTAALQMENSIIRKEFFDLTKVVLGASDDDLRKIANTIAGSTSAASAPFLALSVSKSQPQLSKDSSQDDFKKVADSPTDNTIPPSFRLGASQSQVQFLVEQKPRSKQQPAAVRMLSPRYNTMVARAKASSPLRSPEPPPAGVRMVSPRRNTAVAESNPRRL